MIFRRKIKADGPWYAWYPVWLYDLQAWGWRELVDRRWELISMDDGYGWVYYSTFKET